MEENNSGLDPQIERVFTYHPPKGNQQDLYTDLRRTAKALAYDIRDKVPQGRERAMALTKLEEMIFWANAGIARSE